MQDHTDKVAPTVKIGHSTKQVRFDLETHTHTYRYKVSQGTTRSSRGSLVDRGANGGIIGNDARIVYTYVHAKVDVTGIDNHELSALKVVDAVSVVQSHKGPVLAFMRRYAYHPQHKTIHSSIQLEHYKNYVSDKAIDAGGQQIIRMIEGYVLPLDIISGLPYLKMHPPTDNDLKTLPYTFLTSGDPWDPRVLDNTISDNPDWFSSIPNLDSIPPYDGPFDDIGQYKLREPDYGPSKPALRRNPDRKGRKHSVRFADLDQSSTLQLLNILVMMH